MKNQFPSHPRFLSMLVLALLALAISQTLDTLMLEYQEGNLLGAMAIYGSARALNAGISMLQGIDIDAFVMSVSIGEILDPLNDLIERFSWVVMMAIASLGIQKVMMGVFASQAVNTVLAIIVVLFLMTIWVQRLHRYRTFSYRTLAVALFLRFSLAFVLLGNALLDHYFFSEPKREAESIVVASQKTVNQTATLAMAESDDAEGQDSTDNGFLNKVKRAVNDTKEKFSSMNDKVTNVSQSVENAISSLLDLIVYFVLQTILLPIVFLFMLYQGLRAILSHPTAFAPALSDHPESLTHSEPIETKA